MDSRCIDKPRAGWAGLKHWKYDAPAGLLVAFISMPLCIGVAIVSGAPPIAGLIGGIVAGFLFPLLGGTHLTIGSPAAGLAPVLLVGVLALGEENLLKGWSLVLAACFIASCIQIVLGWLKAANYSAIFPTAVIEGMLAAIGLLIIGKELPHLTGYSYQAHEFFEYVWETPDALTHAHGPVLGLGVTCLILLFLLAVVKDRYAKLLPVELTVVLIAVVLGRWLGIGSEYCINIPTDPFAGLVLPDFVGLVGEASLWPLVVVAVVKITLVSSIESLATVSAIDRKDPWGRPSNSNQALMTVGVASACSSMFGGLPIIPESVRSTACIQGGGRTLWVNGYNAVFLLAFLLWGRGFINLIPFSALAAVLVYTGWKLCRPKIWQHMAHVGWEQLLLFTVTVLTTLASDLLWGLLAGIVVKLMIAMYYGRCFGDLFRNPVRWRKISGAHAFLIFRGPVVCFNGHHLEAELKSIPLTTTRIRLQIADVNLIDHTSCGRLLSFVHSYQQAGCDVEIIGWEGMRRQSVVEASMRFSSPLTAPL